MSEQPTAPPTPKLPLATWLVPVLALVLLGTFLMMGKTPVTPAKPPHLRTPDGKELPGTPATGDPAAPGRTPEEPAIPQPAPTPVAPIIPGATLITDTPYWRYSITGKAFNDVRDYYLGYFGDKIQYAESLIPATGLKRAICFASGEPEAIQISETSEAGVLELAIGPIAMLRGAE